MTCYLAPLTSSKLTARESATPEERRGRFACCTGQGSGWMSPIMSVRFMSIEARGSRNLAHQDGGKGEMKERERWRSERERVGERWSSEAHSSSVRHSRTVD